MSLRRWRLRTMMIGIAVLTIPLAIGVELKRRSDRYRRLAAEHALWADYPGFDPDLPDTWIYRNPILELSPPSYFESYAMREHPEAHRALAAKYAYAASHPWVTVPPQEYWAWSPGNHLVVREMQ